MTRLLKWKKVKNLTDYKSQFWDFDIQTFDDLAIKFKTSKLQKKSENMWTLIKIVYFITAASG